MLEQVTTIDSEHNVTLLALQDQVIPEFKDIFSYAWTPLEEVVEV